MSEERPAESTRDRVRALVREVLQHAAPAEEEAPVSHPPREHPPRAPVPTLAPAAAEKQAAAEKEYDRDESSKTVITEDDVRGLPEGSRLRVAESARLTPLAADIVRERRIELVRRVPRRGARAEKIIAVGADHGGFPLKEELKGFLVELGHPRRDFGTNSTDAVDY